MHPNRPAVTFTIVDPNRDRAAVERLLRELLLEKLGAEGGAPRPPAGPER